MSLRIASRALLCPSAASRVQRRSVVRVHAALFHAAANVRANVTSGNKQVQKSAAEEFEDNYKLQGPDGDRGDERHEREARSKMKRVPRFQGDFSSLEERHILFGARGTVENPVVIESVFPSRIVGCFGSAETQQHDLLWHVVHHERQSVCLECGQVFKLQVPAGEHMHHREHDAHHH